MLNISVRKLVVLQIVFIALAIFLIPNVALASIDDGGMRIYNKLKGIGKWVIIIKGSIDTIQAVLNGDYQSAKKQFMGYLLCFAILLALPSGLNEIEGVF